MMDYSSRRGDRGSSVLHPGTLAALPTATELMLAAGRGLRPASNSSPGPPAVFTCPSLTLPLYHAHIRQHFSKVLTHFNLTYTP